jgi:predicted permease
VSGGWEGVRRLLRIPTRRAVARDVDAELRFHFESRVADLKARGHSPDAATRLAEREFGDLGESRRELIDVDERRRQRVHRSERVSAWRDDVRFSLRALRRTPGLSAMIIVLFALGIGANAAAFSVADALFLRRPAGVAEPDGLMRLYTRVEHSNGKVTIVSPLFMYATYPTISEALGNRTALAAYSPPDSEFVGIGSAVRNLQVVYASSNYFSVLGARLAFGRTFTNDENRMGAGTPVAVISYVVWQREFHGDSTVLGKQIEVEMARYTIIGVAARDFNGPDLNRTEIWLPIAMRPGPVIGGTPWYKYWNTTAIVRLIARPRPGVDRATIAAIATDAFRRGEIAYSQGFPDTTATMLAGPVLESLAPSVTPPVERALTSRLLGVTLIVLLIACANVVNLLLLRGVRRRREIAIRLSLGISRGRLVRQLLIEAVLLSLAASLVSLVVAWWGGTLLRAMLLPSTHWASGAMTWRVVVATVVVAVVTGLVAGVVPALRASRTDLTTSLKSGSREGGAVRSRLRGGLVVTQAALSVALLAGAGLFLASLHEVHSIDVGYDIDRLVYGTVLFRDPQNRDVEYWQNNRAAELSKGLADVADRLRGDPEIDGTALASSPPMDGYAAYAISRRDGSPLPPINNHAPALIAAQPSYFAVAGVKLLRGRLLTESDERAPSLVLVINETAARTYWPGGDPIGDCLRIRAAGKSDCAMIVGIVRNSHLGNIVEPPTPEMFAPILSNFQAHPGYLVVRAAAGHVAAARATLRRELAKQFQNAEPPYVRSAAEVREPELRPWRLGAALFSIFGVLALIVASIGVYCTLAYEVGQRLHEMGVRIALGARRGEIVRLVLGYGMRSLVIGVAGGLVVTLLLGRLVASMLYETQPTNPVVLGTAAAALLVTGLLGSLVPAWRAMRVDPVVALRAD